MLLRKLKIAIILTIFSAALISCDSWTPPKAWTIRPDGVFRRAMSEDECKAANKPFPCKEELSLVQFIDMVKTLDGKSFAIVVTPSGEQSIANEIDHLRKQLEACNGN